MTPPEQRVASSHKPRILFLYGSLRKRSYSRLLAEEACDIIGAARQSLADPDWLRKIALGLGDSVRLCEYTNYCEGLDQKHKPVTCQLWDREALDAPGVRLSADGKRRMVAPDWEPPVETENG